MNWMTDRSEHFTTKLQYSNTHRAEWKAEGNLLANTVTSVPSGAVDSPRIVSIPLTAMYPINGYINYPAPYGAVQVGVESNGHFAVSTNNSWTKPIVIDYVIQQGHSTLASQAVISSGKLPQSQPAVLPAAHYVGNHASGIAGHAWEGTEASKKLVSFTVKLPTAKPQPCRWQYR